MHAIPTFRTDAEADLYAEKHRPFARSMRWSDFADILYRERYGRRALLAAIDGCEAAERGDDHRLHLSMIALSHRLYAEHPELFEPKDRPHDQKR